MVFDDIIIGSGLTALATACGLQGSRRVLVLTGGSRDKLAFYDTGSSIPCLNLGLGGLGNFWHGVIPVTAAGSKCPSDVAAFDELFGLFYPAESLPDVASGSWLYVPYRPVRPKEHWSRLQSARGDHLKLAHLEAQSITDDQGRWIAQTSAGRFEGRRIWLAAGALGTPALLDRSPMMANTTSETASDHVILYLGQVDRHEHRQFSVPAVRRGASGIWLQAIDRAGDLGLVTVKPARFDYRQLDRGIQQRSAFGLPASGIFRKLLRAGSMGLLAESLFNKFGLFPNAGMLSVYAQVRVAHGYRRLPGLQGVEAIEELITAGILNARQRLTLPGLRPSRQPGLYVRAIHLHGTVHPDRLASASGVAASRIQVVDASAVQDIGNEHHSFRLMVSAYQRARQSVAS